MSYSLRGLRGLLNRSIAEAFAWPRPGDDQIGCPTAAAKLAALSLPDRCLRRLSIGTLIGLGIAALVFLAFIIPVFVFFYLFLYVNPRGLDTGLKLQHL